jgi:phosphatidylethanolamine/phosphatidyl-N-methylethanolamine N-methyltransferase
LQSEPACHTRPRGQKPNPRLDNILADEARFFKSWLDNPLLTGAVSPSGPALAQMMARAIDPAATGPIVELGPGTGAITQALLDRGVEPSRLILVEFDESFCKLLAERFPDVRVVRGDAYDLKKTLGAQLDQPIAAVVSSLPLLTKPERVRLVLLADAFELLAPEGIFVQFTYSFNSPIPRKAHPSKAHPIAFEAEASPRIWLNLPPARVWIYRPLGATPQPRGRGGRKVFRPLKSNANLSDANMRAHFRIGWDAAKLRIQTFVRDLCAPLDGPCKPARALSRKLPELDK